MKNIRIIALAGLLSSAAFNVALAADAIPMPMTKYFAFSENGYDYEPPLNGKPGPVTHDPHYPYCPNGTPGCTVSPRMGDEHSPILQPWAQSVVIEWNRDILKGKQAFVGQSRCWPTNTPTVMLLAGGRWQFPISKDEYMIIYERGPAVRHIVAVANASQTAVLHVHFGTADKTGQVEAMLYDRLRLIFKSRNAQVTKNAEIRGYSSTPWHVDALVRVKDQSTIFEAVSKHPVSIAAATMKFNDIGRMGTSAPKRIAVVRNKQELGTYLGVLSQSANVIEDSVPNDTIAKLAMAA